MGKFRIVLVEDELIIAQDLTAVLKEKNYDVVATIRTGEKALEACREHEPDLIIMDLPLHGETDMIKTAQAIRTEFGIPIIFLTTLCGNSLKVLQEAVHCINKPFSENEIYTIIETALENHGRNPK